MAEETEIHHVMVRLQEKINLSCRPDAEPPDSTEIDIPAGLAREAIRLLQQLKDFERREKTVVDPLRSKANGLEYEKSLLQAKLDDALKKLTEAGDMIGAMHLAFSVGDNRKDECKQRCREIAKYVADMTA